MNRFPLLLALLLLTVPAAAQTTIVGRIVGADGRPMKAAHVSVARSRSDPGAVAHAVGSDGRFSVVVRDTALRLVQFTGVDHIGGEIAVIGSKTPERVTVDVRLATYPYMPNLDGVQIIGDFNGFSWETGLPMQRMPDGTYRAEIPARGDSVAYQLLHIVPDRSINGTEGAVWRYDGGGDYESVLPVGGSTITVTFDPRRLVRSTRPGTITFGDGAPAASRVDAEYKALFAAILEHSREATAASDDTVAQREIRQRLLEAREVLAGRLRSEKDPRVRRLKAARYLYIVGALYGDAPADPSLRRVLRDAVEPTSPLFSLSTSILWGAMDVVDSGQRRRFLYDVVDRHHDAAVRFETGQSLASSVLELEPAQRQRFLAHLTGELTAAPERAFYREAALRLAAWLKDSAARSAVLVGRLLDSNAHPVVGATVSLSSGWMMSVTSFAKTDSNGRFSLATRDRGLLQLGHTKNWKGWSRWLPIVDADTLRFDAQLIGAPQRFSDGRIDVVRIDTTRPIGRIVASQLRNGDRDLLYRTALREHIERGGERSSFAFDWSGYRPHLDWIDSALAAERSSDVRDALLFERLDLIGRLADSNARSMAKETRLRILREVPPRSWQWAIDTDRLVFTMWSLSQDSAHADGFWSYIDRFEAEHPDEYLRSEVLYRIAEAGFGTAEQTTQRRAGDSIVIARGHAALARLEQQYPHASMTAKARERFGGARLDRGSQAPVFTFASLDDSTRVFTRENMLGRVYLIDLWATWCGPCIGEMPSLHEAYEKYHDRGFEILSISLDGSTSDVTKFRADRWKMPWLHAFSRGGFESAAARVFGVDGIPATFLVGRDGRIIERGVRGERLVKLLEGELSAHQ